MTPAQLFITPVYVCSQWVSAPKPAAAAAHRWDVQQPGPDAQGQTNRRWVRGAGREGRTLNPPIPTAVTTSPRSDQPAL